MSEEEKITTNVTDEEKIETIESENVLANGVIIIRSRVITNMTFVERAYF